MATHCLLHYNEMKKNQLVDLIQEAKNTRKISESDVERFGDLDRIVTTLQETSCMKKRKKGVIKVSLINYFSARYRRCDSGLCH